MTGLAGVPGGVRAWVTGELMLGGIVLLGSCVQWLTGMGFALVAVPVLGAAARAGRGRRPRELRRRGDLCRGAGRRVAAVRPRAMVPLCLAAALTVPVGSWVARRLPPASCWFSWARW